MSEIGDAIEEIRRELADSAGEFLTRTCTLKRSNTQTSDGFSGHTAGAPSTIATDVPCKLETPSGGVRINEGGAMVTRTYRLTLPVTDETILIDQHYQIDVDEEGLSNQVLLDRPVVLLGDTDVLMTVAADEVTGYAQPAMT